MGKSADCANCQIPLFERACFVEGGKGDKSCPTLREKELIEKIREIYQEPEIKEFARLASVQEGEGYLERERKPYLPHPGKPRIQEIVEFARKMGYKKLGLAFCIGLQKEAELFARFLRAQGFEVVSVICKFGRIEKEELGVKDEEKILIGTRETACNPIGQALYLNQAGTDFNLALGLCVGHDSLFFKYSQAPVSVVAVKDRLCGHNPLAPLYTLTSYYMYLLRPGF